MNRQEICAYQLMFGQPVVKRHAEDKMLNSGVSPIVINGLINAGQMKQKIALNASGSNQRTIKTIVVPTPSFITEKTPSQCNVFFPMQKSMQVYPQPKQTFIGPAHNLGPYIPNNNSTNSAESNAKLNAKYLAISELGLGIIESGAEYILEIKNYDLFKNTFNEGKFLANYNGMKAWKFSFQGNKAISNELVVLEKAKFLKGFKTLKLVKFAGTVGSIGGTFIDIYSAGQKNTTESYTKLAVDIFFTGVAFIPPFGWVVSGVYGIVDASLSAADVDWFHGVWENFMAPTAQLFREAQFQLNKFEQDLKRMTPGSTFRAPY